MTLMLLPIHVIIHHSARHLESLFYHVICRDAWIQRQIIINLRLCVHKYGTSVLPMESVQNGPNGPKFASPQGTTYERARPILAWLRQAGMCSSHRRDVVG